MVMNLHPTESYADYDLPLPVGRYELALDSDASEFNGFGRLEPKQIIDAGTGGQKLYLPNRSAQIYKYQPPA